ncbi:hypothetical protein P2318_10595 [Myxococcaceae bacterium GXIMD 01537]
MAEGIPPRGESLRNAARWIAGRRAEEPHAPLIQLIDEAARRFDLSPSQEQLLLADLLPTWSETPAP